MEKTRQCNENLFDEQDKVLEQFQLDRTNDNDIIASLVRTKNKEEFIRRALRFAIKVIKYANAHPELDVIPLKRYSSASNNSKATA